MESETVHDAYDTSSQSFNILAMSLKSKVHAPDFLQATLSTASTASATPAAKYEYVPFGMGRIRVVCCSLLWKLLQQRAAFVWVMYTLLEFLGSEHQVTVAQSWESWLKATGYTKQVALEFVYTGPCNGVVHWSIKGCMQLRVHSGSSRFPFDFFIHV